MEPRALIFVKIFGELTTTFIYNEICELSQHIEVKVITTKYINRELFPFPLEKIEILPFYESKTKKRIKHRLQKYNIQLEEKNTSFAKRLSDIIQSFSPTHIHCHFGTHSFFILDNLAHNKIPIFISFHGYDASQKLKHRVYKKRLQELFQKKNIYPILVSNYMKDNLKKEKLPLKDPFILYYGTDISQFKRNSYAEERDPLIFFQLARFTEKKGHEYTLKAFASFLEEKVSPNAKLILAGDGPLWEPMKQLAEELAIDKYVEFVGAVTQSKGLEYLEQAHIFLHHSVTAQNNDKEGIPNAIMEAMAMELPIIATYHSGIPELVEDGVNGFLVEERDVNSYSKKMRQIASWSYLPINREKIKQKFERKAHCGELIKMYKSVLSAYSTIGADH